MDILKDLSFEDIINQENEVTEKAENAECDCKQEYITDNKCIDKFKVIKVIGKLSNNTYSPTFAIISWNGSMRYDVRKRENNYSSPKKGMAFTKYELKLLLDQYADINIAQLGVKKRAEYDTSAVSAIIYERIGKVNSFHNNSEIWSKEINVIDWGYGKKIDLRKWNENYTKCSKGICLTIEEFQKLLVMISNIL